MKIDKFSDSGIFIMRQAQNIAIKYGNIELTELHIHLSIVNQNNNIIHNILSDKGIDIFSYVSDIETAISKLEHQDALTKLYYNRTTQKILLVAEDIARLMYKPLIEPEHIYLAILKENKVTSQSIFSKYNIIYDDVYNEVINRNSEIKIKNNQIEGLSSILLKYGRNLTEEAIHGKLDPVIGRDNEIKRMIRILSRRTKNNPVIIGDPGVGKTAIVEGLAQRIVSNEVPDTLSKKIIYSLDLSSIVAGTKYRGEFEERLKEVLNILVSSNGQIILYIDELHTVVGTGDSSGGLDTSNILKPLLARGEILTIGSTTYDEYKKYIEKDGALERRFQKIQIDAPNVSETISILRGIKSKYEMHHGIRISDKAIIACATLSDRYITDRFLPDKAIDLMDEAASMVRTQIDSIPHNIDELQRKILQLEMEKISLREENDNISKLRKQKIEEELNNLKLIYESEFKTWIEDKKIVEKVKKVKQQINEVKIQIDDATRKNDFEKISELKLITLKNLENEETRLTENNSRYKLKEEVNEDDIAEVVSKWTQIPINKLTESEKQKILNLNTTMKEYIVGQNHAIDAICSSIIRVKSGIRKINKPVGSYLFLGPTGVGKTYLAKVLTKTMFDSEQSLIRLDMSEYMDKNTVSKLVGAPPGYVGYEEGGVLTEAVRRHPYSVVLFDEIEKANTEIFNLLLQVLDEGRLTDNKGRIIDFKNTIIILTSNIGAEKLLNNNTINSCSTNNLNNKYDLHTIQDSQKIKYDNHLYSDQNTQYTQHNSNKLKYVKNKDIAVMNEDIVIKELQTYFKPEFLNRLDDIIVFNSFNKSDASKIINLEIEQINNDLMDKMININITDNTINHIIDKAFSFEFGARPLKRFINKEIITKIGSEMLEDKIHTNSNIIVDYDNKIIIKIKEK